MDGFERAIVRGIRDYGIERRKLARRAALRIGSAALILALALGIGGWHLYSSARHEAAVRTSISACVDASSRTASTYDRAVALFNRGVKAEQSLDQSAADMAGVIALVEKPVPVPKSRDCTVDPDKTRAGYERDARSLDDFSARLDRALGPKS